MALAPPALLAGTSRDEPAADPAAAQPAWSQAAMQPRPAALAADAPAPDPPPPNQIVVKLRKGSKAAAALDHATKDAKTAGKRLDGEHELRGLLDRHGVKSSDAVFGRAKRDRAAEQARAKAGKDDKESKRDQLFRWCRLDLPAGADPAQVAAEFMANPAVECAEPVIEYQLSDIDPPITGLPDTTTDPMISEQFYHNKVKSQAAWNYLKQNGVPMGGYSDVVVAVIDSGTDYNHQDLVANIWTNPREIPGNNLDDDANGFIDDIHGCSVTSDARSHSGDPIDLHGHGTHVAGIIAATAFNHLGGVGVSFGVKIMPIRAAHYSGAMTSTDISEGILYAVDNGAEVINMSFGGPQRSQIMADALQVALSQAALVAAAGNDGSYIPRFPAAFHYVIGVMSCDGDGRMSWFSNRTGDITAPGESILSTLPGDGYAAWSGTSMATPVVSGIAALMRSYFWMREIWSSRFIMGSILNSGAEGGIVDAYKALTEPPQPGVTVLDTWLFDNKSIDPGNDADGRVDSGETVHLGVELMNRAGEAEEVTAHLEAWAEGAVMPDPYVNITVPDIYFGNIGPFNTSDNGFIYDSQGVITGVDEPFVFEVSPDCPNEHVIEFEMTTTFYDGWNLEHPGPYTRISRFQYVVQRGKNLPSVISSNMELTADEYWMVGGPVLVEPGVTLTIRPGTQVQWGAISSDPYNPGPQTGSMLVRGNLRIEGTCESPVSLFPSYMVSGQRVNIAVETGGSANVAYAKVRNPNVTGFGTIDHAYFDWDFYESYITASIIRNSVFHKLRGGGMLSADLFDRCLFDAGWIGPWFRWDSPPRSIINCTFLQDNENNHPLSIVDPPRQLDRQYFGGAWSNRDQTSWGTWFGIYHALESNGFTYVTLPADSSRQLQEAELIAQYFGGHVTNVSSPEEQSVLESYVTSNLTYQGRPPIHTLLIGMTDGGTPGTYRWLDGSPLQYLNWDTNHPVELPALSVNTVAIYNSGSGFFDRSVPWRGPWRNLQSFQQYRTSGFTYNFAPGFILKLPGSWTSEQLNAEIATGNVLNFVRPRMKGDIIHNAFLNRYWDPNVNNWMRIRAPGYVQGYVAMNFNYWGTSSTTLIDHLIVDYNDNFTTSRVDYQPPPAHGYATTYPFVEQVLVNGIPIDSVPKLGTERVDFTVTFNRDMDMTVEPFVTFGPSPPHTDFQVTARDEDFHPIDSGWLDPRTWQGSAWITPMSGDGYHLMRISGAVAADDPWLVSGYDVGRFRFEVRSMEVAAMTLQANGLEGAIQLMWAQDDFDLLAGYNLYRATSAAGPWTKLNTTVIPPGSESYTDTAVSPAVPMYYKFTVVSTDFEESDFSNVAMAAAVDTIGPSLSHVPVTSAPPARGLRLTATASDNLRVTAVIAHYRPLGSTGAFTEVPLANLSGNNWTGTVPGLAVVEPGIEYYLVASDGIGEAFSGTPVLPHQVTVVNVPTLSSVTPSQGPATGGTTVTLGGMLFEPGISVLFGGVLAGNVQVLNENQLTCVTPAHFPALVDVKVVNPDSRESTLLNGFRFEETGVVVSLPHGSGDYGAQVEVAVSASNLVGLRGADLAVTWNPAVLTAVSARVGTLTAGWALASNLTNAGRGVFSLASAGSVSGSGSLVIVRFNVVGSPPASTPLALESVSLNDGALDSTLSNGSFTVNGFFDLAGAVRYFQGNGAVPGVQLSLAGVTSATAATNAAGVFGFSDIPLGAYVLTPHKADGVAEITAYDASLVLQRAAGLIGLSPAQTAAADVNRSGTVSAMDASYVLEAAVGLLSPPFPGAGKVWDFTPAERSYGLLNADLTNQDFTAVLIGDVSGNWTSGAAPAPPVIQSGAVAYAFVHDPLNVAEQNSALLLVKSTQPAIYGLDLTVSFDPARTLAEVRTGSLGHNHSLAVRSPAPGSARIAAASALPVTGEGVLLELRFDGPPGGLAVTGIRVDESQVAAVADPQWDVFDTDHDGVVNVVETDVYQSDPELVDSDGDGRPDGAEVAAGTLPTDTASFFALKSIAALPGGSVRLAWDSVAGRVYTVQATDDLTGGAWQDVPPAVTADGPSTTVTVTLPAAARRMFYRLMVAPRY